MSRGFYTLHDSGHVRHFEVTSACVSRALKFPTLGGPLVVEAVRGRDTLAPKITPPSGC